MTILVNWESLYSDGNTYPNAEPIPNDLKQFVDKFISTLVSDEIILPIITLLQDDPAKWLGVSLEWRINHINLKIELKDNSLTILYNNSGSSKEHLGAHAPIQFESSSSIRKLERVVQHFLFPQKPLFA